MDGIDDMDIRVIICQTADRAEHLMHLRTLIFPAVGCHQDEFPFTDCFQHRMDVIGLDRRL